MAEPDPDLDLEEPPAEELPAEEPPVGAPPVEEQLFPAERLLAVADGPPLAPEEADDADRRPLLPLELLAWDGTDHLIGLRCSGSEVVVRAGRPPTRRPLALKRITRWARAGRLTLHGTDGVDVDVRTGRFYAVDVCGPSGIGGDGGGAGVVGDPDLVAALRRVSGEPEFWEGLRSPDLARRIFDLEPGQHAEGLDDDYLDDIATALDDLAGGREGAAVRQRQPVRRIGQGGEDVAARVERRHGHGSAFR